MLTHFTLLQHYKKKYIDDKSLGGNEIFTMAKFAKLERLAMVVGYKNATEMIIKYFLPFAGLSLFLIILLSLFISSSLIMLLVVALLGLGVVGYPLTLYSTKKKEINTNLHFFITYAGTVSTMDISRTGLFKHIAQKGTFGEISDIFRKALYIAKEWNLGFAGTCRTMARRVPSNIFRDFLDRLAVIMDFGQDLQTFFHEEQEAILDDYQAEYQKSLEVIKLIQELFIAFSISFSFTLAIALLAPVLLDYPMENLILYSSIVIILIDVVLIIMILQFIPSDPVFHSFDNYKEIRQTKVVFWVTLAFCSLIFLILGLLPIPFFLRFAMSVTPLLLPAVMGSVAEDNVLKRDRQFPLLSRVLGSAIEVRNGAVITSLRSIQVHEFGSLHQMVVGLYRRLRIGSDKYKCWHLFAVESGSNLITNFSRIFAESVYLGGNAEQIGEIVSKNTQRLLSMRKMRLQLAQGLRGAFYGSLVGLAATMYVTSKISEMLVQLFSPPTDVQEATASFVGSIIGSSVEVDFTKVMFYISMMIIGHAIASSTILKIIDGGSWYSSMVDFIIMVWIGALLSIFLPDIVQSFLPDVSTVWTGGGPESFA